MHINIILNKPSDEVVGTMLAKSLAGIVRDRIDKLPNDDLKLRAYEEIIRRLEDTSQLQIG